MKTLWKSTIEEQIWYGNKIKEFRFDSILHYSELPPNEIYESKDFESVYSYLEKHGTAAYQGTSWVNNRHLIIFHPPYSYDFTRINKQKFKKYQHIINGVECSVKFYTLTDLQDKLPATEFIDFLKDNFKNPLDKLSNL